MLTAKQQPDGMCHADSVRLYGRLQVGTDEQNLRSFKEQTNRGFKGGFERKRTARKRSEVAGMPKRNG